MREILYQSHKISRSLSKKKKMLYHCQMGIQYILLHFNDNICLRNFIANELYANLAWREWRLYWLHSICQFIWRGYIRNGNLLWDSVWKTFWKVFPTRFYQAWRQLLWIHFAPCTFNVLDIFLLHDEFLDDRNLPSHDSWCQWCVFNYSESVQRL